MKAPEIPGRIIAHIAFAPERNMIMFEWFVAVFVNPVSIIAKRIPMSSDGMFFK